MKLWQLFVVGAVVCWGLYVPTIHAGQVALNKAALRAFLCVGFAYFLTAVLAPGGMLAAGMESGKTFTQNGVLLSILAGVFGAGGALCVILSLKNGGSPLYVAPLVFAGAPLVNVIASMAMHPPKGAISPMLYVGFLMAAGGAGLVLYFKPA